MSRAVPLDPQAAAHLEAVKSWGLPPVEDIPVEELRRIVRSMTVVSNEPVHAVIDETVPGPSGEIPIRVYRPNGRDGLPIFVYFHGGGWVMCGVDSHDHFCRKLTSASQCLVASVDYRLAPEHKFPAALHEAHAVISWLAEHADRVGGNGSALAVGGDSAGGNLATAVAMLARDRGAPLLLHQLLIYPMLDSRCDSASMAEFGDGYGLNRSTASWFWSQYLRSPADARDPYAVPLHASSLAAMPDATIVLAGSDPLRDEGEAYAAALVATGASVTVMHYPDMIHGFLLQTDTIDRARTAIDAISALLRCALSTTS